MPSFGLKGPRDTLPKKKGHLVAVVAFDGVVLGDLSTPCEILGRVRGRDGRLFYDVRICSLAPEVKSEHVTLRVPWRLSSLNRADTVIVPGIADLDQSIPEGLLRAIRRAVDRRARVASICTGAFVLAGTGALDGLRATTHWRGAAELARRYPAIDVDADVLYVDNGHVLTSAGAAAGFRSVSSPRATRSASASATPCAINGPSWKHVISPETELPYADTSSDRQRNSSGSAPQSAGR